MKTLWGDEAIPEVKTTAAPVASKAVPATTMWGDPVASPTSPKPIASPIASGKRKYSYKDLENALAKQESGGDYNAIGKPYKKKDGSLASMDLGQIAIGKYQIVPETWFKTIGLDHLKKSDRRKFWKSPYLQEQAFKNVIAENRKAYPGSIDKQIVAYYGGPRAAEGLGTAGADTEYNGVSHNEYLRSVKGHMREAGPTGRFIGEPPAEDKPQPQIAASPAPHIPGRSSIERQPWTNVSMGFGAKLPEVIKEVDPEEEAATRALAKQAQEDIAAGKSYSQARKEWVKKAWGPNALQTFTPEKYAAMQQPGGDKRGGLSKVADAILGTSKSVMNVATGVIQGKSQEQMAGERIRVANTEAEYKKTWESPEGKETIKRARQKLESGETLDEQETRAIAEKPGFIQSMKDLGQALKDDPSKVVKDMAIQIINDGPILAIASMGIGSLYSVAKSAGYAYKGARLVRQAKALAKNPAALEARAASKTLAAVKAADKGKAIGEAPVVVPSARAIKKAEGIAKARTAEGEAQRALQKQGFLERNLEDQVQNIGAEVAVSYPTKKAQGGTYTGSDAAQALTLGSAIGAGTSLHGALTDVRAPKKIVEGARNVAHLSTFQKHPEVQSMLPMFDAIAKNKATSGARYKASAAEGAEWTREMLDKAGYKDRVPGKQDIAGQLLVDKKTGKITNQAVIGKSGDKAAIAEETTHYLQDQLKQRAKTDPEMATVLKDIKEWEAGIKEAEKAHNASNPGNKITLPTGDELFGQTFTKYMGYGKHFTREGSIVSRLVLPDNVIKGFKKLMGDDPALKGDGIGETGDIAAKPPAPPKPVEQPKPAPRPEPMPTPMDAAKITKAAKFAFGDKTPSRPPATLEVSALGDVQAAREPAVAARKLMPVEAAPPVQIIPTEALKAKASAVRQAAKAAADRAIAQSEIPDELLAKANNSKLTKAVEEPTTPESMPPSKGIAQSRFNDIKAYLRRQKLPNKDADILEWARANRDTEIPKPSAAEPKAAKPAGEMTTHIGARVVDALTVVGSNGKKTNLIRLHPDDVGKVVGVKASTGAMMTSKEVGEAIGRRVVVSEAAPKLQDIADKFNESRSMAEHATRSLDQAEGSGPNGDFTHDDLAQAISAHRGTRADVKKLDAAANKKAKALDLGYDPNKYAPEEPYKPLSKSDMMKTYDELEAEGKAPFQLKRSEPQEKTSKFIRDFVESIKAKPRDYEWPRKPTPQEIKDQIDYSDARGETRFQLKKSGLVKGEQEDMFGNKGRVASQGFINGKNGDKGLEDTPLFGAADAEEAAKAQKDQQSLFQLKRANPEDVFKGKSDGDPAMVERKIKSFRENERILGLIPKELARDLSVKWADNADEVVKMAHEDLSYFENIGSRRILDPVETFALEAKSKGMEIHNQQLLDKLNEAKAKKLPEEKFLSAEYAQAVIELMRAEEVRLNGGTRAGRALAAHAMEMEPFKFSSDIAVMRKLSKDFKHLTQRQIADLVMVLRKNPEKFQAELRKLMASSLLEKALEQQSAGLLTGLGTHLGNVISNTFERSMLTLESAVAGGADAALQKIYGGDRVRYMSDARHELSAIQESVVPAIKQFSKDMAEVAKLKDKPLDPTAKWDQQIGHIPGAYGRLVRTSFRSLEAMDKTFKTIGTAASIRKQAGWVAAKEGLSGEAAFKRIVEIEKEIKADPTAHPGIVRQAAKDADFGVFQNDVDRFTQKIINLKRDFKVLSAVMPYTKTPSNILRRTIDRSPLSLSPWGDSGTRAFMDFRDAVKRGAPKPEIQKLRGIAADRIARTTLGTVMFSSVLGMAYSGLLVGGGPKDQQENYAWQKTGAQPYSVRVPLGNKKFAYIPFSRIEPLSTALAIAADIADGKNNAEVMPMIESIGKNLFNKTYMTGALDFLEAAQGVMKGQEGAANKYFANLASTFVPFSSLLNRTAMATDEKIRDKKPERKGISGFPELLANTIIAKTPGASKLLPPLEEGEGGQAARTGSRFGNFLGIFNASLSNNDFKAIEAAVELGYRHAPPPKEVYPMGRKKGLVAINDEETKVFQKANAEATKEIEKKMKLRSWETMDDGERKDLIQDVYRDHQRPALSQVKSLVRKRIK